MKRCVAIPSLLLLCACGGCGGGSSGQPSGTPTGPTTPAAGTWSVTRNGTILQINYGSGKDVNSETIADAARPVRVRWHARSHIEIQTGRP